MSAQRMALDFQRSREELAEERARTEKLFAEIDRLNAENDRLRSSTRRESNSRLIAEEALNKTQDRMQFAIEAAGLALWDWLVASPEAFVTGRWGEMIGMVAIDGHWNLQEMRKQVHPDDLGQTLAVLKRLLADEPGPHFARYRVPKGSDWLWVESHGMVAERDAQGRPFRLMGTHADITLHKQEEQELEQARLLAQRANEAKSRFVAGISHEVRTPLNALMGLIQLMQDSPLNADQKRWADLMDRSANALLTLVSDVLDFSRIEAGKVKIESLRFDLHDLLHEASNLYADQARAKTVGWHLVISPQVSQFAQGDPNRLRQVLLNLLSNALKFTPPGGRVTLSADLHTGSSGNGGAPELRLRVQDTGPGIPKSEHAQVFEAFDQGDSSTARRFGGSGLGLPISANLMRLMGGRIDLDSELGKGSSFVAAMPWKSTQAAEATGTDTTVSTSLSTQLATQRFVGLSVLVADDHPVNVLLLEELLSRLGCKPRVARDGLEAVAEYKRGGIDLVLMDVQMPGISGLEATRQIREAEAGQGSQRLPIIAITANATVGDREACLAAGLDGYLSKPIRPVNLLAEMGRICDAMLPQLVPAAAEPAGDGWRTSTAPLPRDLQVDEATQRAMAGLLKKDFPLRMSLLREALEHQSVEQALKQTHLLRGVLGLVKAVREERLTRGLEVAARAGEWGLFAKVFPLLEEAMAQLQASLPDNAAVNSTSASAESGPAPE
jgi:signal transduction histidine kinase/DNA-binding response OmpR family regulator